MLKSTPSGLFLVALRPPRTSSGKLALLLTKVEHKDSGRLHLSIPQNLARHQLKLGT